MRGLKPALFLDRDGVINQDRGFVSDIPSWAWMAGAIECVRNFKARDWYVFIVTNQSGIAFGYYTEADMHQVHAHMMAGFADAGTSVDAVYTCPFHPEASDRRYRKSTHNRKPGPGMILQAMADFPVKREASFLIGDKPTDIMAAHAAGIGGFLFQGGNLAEFADWALADFEGGAR